VSGSVEIEELFADGDPGRAHAALADVVEIEQVPALGAGARLEVGDQLVGALLGLLVAAGAGERLDQVAPRGTEVWRGVGMVVTSLHREVLSLGATTAWKTA
jgi:hypothetical protein